jgi:phage shock protein A
MNRDIGSRAAAEIQSLRRQIAQLEQDQVDSANELRELRTKLRELESRWRSVLGSRATQQE